MLGPCRPQIVLFGSSIVQFSFANGGWGATLADIYARKGFLKLRIKKWLRNPMIRCIVITPSLVVAIIGGSSPAWMLVVASLAELEDPPIMATTKLVNLDILLRGYSGWNTRRALEVIEKVFPKDADIQPSLVIMYFGGNDAMGPHSSGLGPHVPLSECKENLRKLANHILSLSEKTRLILLSCPPVNEDMFQSTTSGIFGQVTRSNEICRQYSEACIELCKEMGLKVVDLWTSIQKRDDWATACLTDGVHFSSEGSDILVAEILQILKEAEWEPSLHWKALPTEFAEDSPYDLAASDGKSTLNISEWIFHREDKWD